MSIGHFLSYHNAVPIAISVVFLGAAGTFAATNPEAIYSQTEKVLSIDNTYLVSKDLALYSPRTQIVTVTEDEENYYVEYLLYTIDLEDYVWKDVSKQKMMKVAKLSLGEYRDLGVYVTGQLKENIQEEIRRLTETQEIERKNVSQKIVATEYGGLVGKMLDTSMQTLPGYTPVVVPPAPAPQVASAAESVGTPQGQGEQNTSPQTEEPAPDPGAPTIDVLGNNPARVPVGSAYADLGAAITGPTLQDQSLGIHIFVNGKETQVPEIDTSKPSEWGIRYEATNAAGKKGIATRTVIVFDPNAKAPETATSTESESAAPPPESAQESPSATTTTETAPPGATSQTEPAATPEPTSSATTTSQ